MLVLVMLMMLVLASTIITHASRTNVTCITITMGLGNMCLRCRPCTLSLCLSFLFTAMAHKLNLL